MTRRLRAALVLAAVLILTSNVAPASAATPLLPDLGMARFSSLSVDTVDGRRLLRFATVVVNVGAGPFELAATRSGPNSTFTTVQEVTGSDGSTAEVPTSATFSYAGDGHDHWHVKDLASYRLDRLNGSRAGTGAKSGFCFFDNITYRLTLPGAPQTPQYDERGCGRKSVSRLTMGLSVGWGDLYPVTLPDQFIDITGLPDGRYRLGGTADALGLFTESDRTNNETWVDISLTTRRDAPTTVTVLSYGPAA